MPLLDAVESLVDELRIANLIAVYTSNDFTDPELKRTARAQITEHLAARQ